MRIELERKIKELVTAREPLSESEVSHLMTLMRKDLDRARNELGAEYQLLRFFCDWSVHITLDRSVSGMKMMQALNSILHEWGDRPPGEEFFDSVTRALSFDELRRQMASFFESARLSDRLTRNKRLWNNFVARLISVVRDCSLELPERTSKKEIKEIREEIVGNPLKEGMWLTGLSLTGIDLELPQGPPSGTETLCVVLRTANTTEIVVPLNRTALFV
jgi:hypothetical protein